MQIHHQRYLFTILYHYNIEPLYAKLQPLCHSSNNLSCRWSYTNLNPPALGTTDYPNTPQTLNQIYKIKFDLNFYIMHSNNIHEDAFVCCSYKILQNTHMCLCVCVCMCVCRYICYNQRCLLLFVCAFED